MTDRTRMARHAALSQSRGLVRAVGIYEEMEFIASLSNVQASVKGLHGSRLEEWNAKLLELLAEIDDDINDIPEVPEYGSERAQFDVRTVRSNKPFQE